MTASRQADKRVPIDPWRRVEIIERAARGESRSRLAREYGLSRSTVQRWLRQFVPKPAALLKAERQPSS